MTSECIHSVVGTYTATDQKPCPRRTKRRQVKTKSPRSYLFPDKKGSVSLWTLAESVSKITQNRHENVYRLLWSLRISIENETNQIQKLVASSCFACCVITFCGHVKGNECAKQPLDIQGFAPSGFVSVRDSCKFLFFFFFVIEDSG